MMRINFVMQLPAPTFVRAIILCIELTSSALSFPPPVWMAPPPRHSSSIQAAGAAAVVSDPNQVALVTLNYESMYLDNLRLLVTRFVEPVSVAVSLCVCPALLQSRSCPLAQTLFMQAHGLTPLHGHLCELPSPLTSLRLNASLLAAAQMGTD